MKVTAVLWLLAFLCESVQPTGGLVSAIPPFLPGPRARAPLSILNKPIVAEFQSIRLRKANDGSEAVEGLLRGRFLRDGRGYTRTEYYDPDPQQQELHLAVAILWNPEDHAVTFISFGERTVETLRGPVYPGEHDWRTEGDVVLRPMSEERIIHGLKCKRVLLVPRENPTLETGDESWISFEWGLVLLEVASTATEEVRWEVVRVQEIEPGSSVFDIPKDFVQK